MAKTKTTAQQQLTEAIEQANSLISSPNKAGIDALGIKAQLVTQLIALEDDESQEHIANLTRLRDDLESKNATQAKDLTDEITALKAENARLKVKAETPNRIVVSDPDTAVVREKLDAANFLLQFVIDALSVEGRAKMAVKITQACEPAVVAHFARVAKVDADQLARFNKVDADDLHRFSQGIDQMNNALARAFSATRFPKASDGPATVGDTTPTGEFPAGYSTWDGDKKVQWAKEQTRRTRGNYLPALAKSF